MTTITPVIAAAVGTSPVALYTWTAGTAELESLDVFNKLTVSVKVDFYLDNNGTNVYIVKSFSLAPGDSMSYRGAIPINSTGQIIYIVSDTAASLDCLGRVTVF